MFESNIRNCLPGYTGHIPSKIEDDQFSNNTAPRK